MASKAAWGDSETSEESETSPPPTRTVNVGDHERKVGCCCCCCCNDIEMVDPGNGEPAHPKDGCEEKCLPGFWEDDQPPPIPPLKQICDPRNKCLNDNARCHIWGNVGTQHADQHRKEIMGTAIAVTVLSIIISIYGCFGALSDDESIVAVTFWTSIWTAHYNHSAGAYDYGWIVRMGLRSYVFDYYIDVEDDFEWWNWKDKIGRESELWNEFEADDKVAEIGDGWDDMMSAVSDCATVAIGDGTWISYAGSQQASAFLGCFTLLFALMGGLTRIRWRQDSNLQKVKNACLSLKLWQTNPSRSPIVHRLHAGHYHIFHEREWDDKFQN